MAAALFVIDIQNDLATNLETKIPHASRVNMAAEKIIAAARTALLDRSEDKSTDPSLSTIVFVQHEEKPEDGPMVKGTDPWKLVFEPVPDNARERLVAKWTRGFRLPRIHRSPLWSIITKKEAPKSDLRIRMQVTPLNPTQTWPPSSRRPGSRRSSRSASSQSAVSSRPAPAPSTPAFASPCSPAPTRPTTAAARRPRKSSARSRSGCGGSGQR